MNNIQLDKRSIELRKEVLKIIDSSRRGHIGSAFSIIEIMRVLYDDIMKYDPENPLWEERDRFILSKGHGCLAMYVLLADKGFFPKEELRKFCSKESILGGHPEWGKIPGVEVSTGSLGHGLSIGTGFALFGKMKNTDFITYVLLGDGECNEGSIWEAAMSAAQHRLDNLVILVDYNKMQSYSATAEIIDMEPFVDKWRSFRCAVREVDGHNIASIREIIEKVPFEQGRPSVIICHTIKGRGIPFIENNASWHHKSKISDEEIKVLYGNLG